MGDDWNRGREEVTRVTSLQSSTKLRLGILTSVGDHFSVRRRQSVRPLLIDFCLPRKYLIMFDFFLSSLLLLLAEVSDSVY